MSGQRVYLDHAAATPLHAEAREAMLGAFDCWANPNSPYEEARKCRKLLEDARSRIAKALDWRHDVIFTSGASEAIMLAGEQARVPGRIHGCTEHAIVPHAMGEDSIELRLTAYQGVDP